MKIENLVNFRKSKSMTIGEFAETLGISYSNYFKIESGERQPNYRFLCKFKKAYPKSSIDDIFFELF